jgi:DNA-directed RNA polymerase specialized sigma24 family protein
MSLITITDEFLATRAASGDETAFAELARRYRPLLRHASRRPSAGLDVEDLRQEALLGLYETCRRYDPAKGPFTALATRNVRQRVQAACTSAWALKHRPLTDAVHDGDDPLQRLEALAPAPAGWDPAHVVGLRDELRFRVEADRRARRERRSRGGYTDEHVDLALGMIKAGRTVKEAAFAVGAPRKTIHCWLKRAGVTPVVGRRRFTEEEIARALALVEQGASLTAAGAAVGASKNAVIRWVRRSGRAAQRQAA